MNTQCTPEPMRFSSLNSQKVQADFDGGALTTDAGALRLREVDRRIGLVDALNACLADPRAGRYTIHDQRSMLAQRIFGIAAGYEDLNDHATLRDDPCFKVLADRPVDPHQPLASTATLWRLEDRVDRPAMVNMVKAFVDRFIASHAATPETIVLDFDASDNPVHGNQENRGFHGYYDEYCFLPLYVYCGDQLRVPYLRPCRIDVAKHSAAILKLLVTRFRQVWPSVRILFRADSGFCRWRTLKWCDRHGVYYLVGLAQNPVLLRLAQPWTVPAEWHSRRTGQKVRLFGSFAYAAETWDRPRRVIVKAEHAAQGPNPRFLVANLPGDPHELYDRGYCPRGDMENRIKEYQLDLFATRTSSHWFLNNQFRLLLAGAAYLLTETLRREGLAGTSLENAQAGTIRTRLLKIGALVRSSARRVVFHLASGFPLQEVFRKAFARLMALPNPSLTSG